jgi:hypothetical protein
MKIRLMAALAALTGLAALSSEQAIASTMAARAAPMMSAAANAATAQNLAPTALLAAEATKYNLVQYATATPSGMLATKITVADGAARAAPASATNMKVAAAPLTANATVEFTVNQAARAAPAMVSQNNNAAASANQHMQSLLSTAAQATLSNRGESTKVHDSGLHDEMAMQLDKKIAGTRTQKTTSTMSAKTQLATTANSGG